MNKQEIEAEIKIHEDRLIDLREMYAEAEKPKLRHGDFGCNDEGYPRLILKSNDEEMFDAGKYKCDDVDGGFAHSLPDPIQGNIFDLMKERGKDSGNFEIDVSFNERKIIFEKSTSVGKDIFITIWGSGIRGDGAHLSLSEIEEMWNKLGTALFTLKRKQGGG